MTNSLSPTAEREAIHARIRAAGGIVHSDGNIFFTNYEKFLAALLEPVGEGAQWTLTAPDGRQWHGETKIKCMAAETSSRVPASVQLERIFAAAEETRQDEERQCREAYDNTYHKVRAAMGYDQWRMVWFKAIDAAIAAPPKTNGGMGS